MSKTSKKRAVRSGMWRKLLGKLSDTCEAHRERRRPSGYGFCLADSIEFVRPGDWDHAASGASLFLQREYLEVLEQAPPENLRMRYAVIYRDRAPVAAAALQVARISASDLRKSASAQVVVCGNLLSWGSHGVALAPEKPRARSGRRWRRPSIAFEGRKGWQVRPA